MGFPQMGPFSGVPLRDSILFRGIKGVPPILGNTVYVCSIIGGAVIRCWDQGMFRVCVAAS